MQKRAEQERKGLREGEQREEGAKVVSAVRSSSMIGASAQTGVWCGDAASAAALL